MIVIVGTPIGDTFVITNNYVAGAGRIVNFTGIEALEVDGAGGPDVFYILSTNPDLVTTIVGGSGDDTIHLGGNPPPLVFDPPSFTYQPPSFTVTPNSLSQETLYPAASATARMGTYSRSSL